uniref:Uncharacterized protein n=1 Tax=Mustela putorius furo TaxID=9669 RepID=M3XN55_MUSPF
MPSHDSEIPRLGAAVAHTTVPPPPTPCPRGLGDGFEADGCGWASARMSGSRRVRECSLGRAWKTLILPFQVEVQMCPSELP